MNEAIKAALDKGDKTGAAVVEVEVANADAVDNAAADGDEGEDGGEDEDILFADGDKSEVIAGLQLAAVDCKLC